MFSPKRSKNNPIIKPNPEHDWEAYSAFNGCPIVKGRNTFLLYRAQSTPKKFESTTFSLSTIGKAVENASGAWDVQGQLITPVEQWEKFGCEDPRVNFIDKKYYIFYTALSLFPFRGEGIKVAVAISKDLKTIQERHLVTPFNAKAMSLFPEKIGGKYTVIFAAHTDNGQLAKISIAQFSKIEDLWNEDKWHEWHKNVDSHALQIPRKDSEQVEIGAPPIRTPYGWLLVYSHIKNYFTEHDKIFGIGAVLLDLKNPQRVIAQTKTPFLIPEEKYEKDGTVPNTIFPSGAILEDDALKVFYGGADTVCAYVEMSLLGLLSSMDFIYKGDIHKKLASYKTAHTFYRIFNEPILAPRADHPWESRAVFNPAAIEIDGTAYILYRAMSEDNTSVMGYAESYDMKNIKVRGPQPVYTPRASFEEKRIPNGNSGCEDPRLTLIEDRIYMTYTAYNGVDVPRIALTSISVDDFTSGIWKWKNPILISNDNVDDKDGALFPEKIKGKYALIHRVNHAVCIDYSNTLEFKNRNEYKNKVILSPRVGMWDSRKVGIAMSPIISEYGWLLIYHGIGEDGCYRVGAALLDMSDAEKVIARTACPIFEPETEYEKRGQVNNVVFPCGAVVKKDILYIYYGEADSVIGVATMKLKDIFALLGIE
jgi:predicted GH43/DUF377 family glycosyl hydrolase